MNGMTLGGFYPGDSLIHRFDPRAKIIAMILLLVAVFYPAGFYGYLIIGFVLILAMILSKIPYGYYLAGFKPMIIMMVFLLIINILVIKNGTLLFSWKWLTVYSEALVQTIYIILRLVFMISTTTLLTATTKPLDLTLGIEDLMTPFKWLGLPTHEISMMISLALRFIPTILEEALRIMKAQQSRGGNMEEGKLQERLRAVISLIIPLFICAFQRAEDLANAMEARGYNPSATRTRFHQLKFVFKDILLICLCISSIVAVIMIGFYI